MSEIKLGQLCPENAERDAIHVAILPATAGTTLYPGQRVGFDETGSAGPVTKPIGIVDPFYQGAINPGSRFWLCLFPGTVTGMRHHWSHPQVADGAQDPIAAATTTEESVRFLRDLAEKCGMSYSVFMTRTQEFLATGIPWTEHDSETARNAMYAADLGVFWDHFERVAGTKVSDEDRKEVPFSCSC